VIDRDLSKPVPDGLPPFLGRWSRLYVAILFYVALVIAALYGLSAAFNYQ
jgi:hypothetical protein